MNADDIKWPRHKAALIVSHNDHKNSYATIEEWESFLNMRPDWASEEERSKAIASDNMWSVQWFPDTPVGSCLKLASSLQACLNAIDADEFEEPKP